jgi:uncharacterized membrane protein YuzA (DUF378 family)
MEHIDKVIYKIAMIVLIIGALNWLFVGLAKFNLVKALFGEGAVARSVYILVGLAAMYVMFNRDFYLPFLGESVLPCAAFKDRIPPGASRTLTLSLQPGTKVLYWAAEPEMDELKNVRDWKTAYAHFENAGVATAGDDGIAYLKVREPQAYTVPLMGGFMQKKIEPHLHYRVCGGDGLLSRVETIYMSVQGNVQGFEAPEMEGFTDAPRAAAAKAPASNGIDEMMRVMKELDKYSLLSAMKA